MNDSEALPLYILGVFILLLVYAHSLAITVAMDNISSTKLRLLADEYMNAGKIRRYNRIQKVLKLLEKPMRYKFTCRLLCLLCFFFSALLVDSLCIFFDFTDYQRLIAFACLVCFIMSMCDIFPRKIALQHKEKLVVIFSPLLSGLTLLLRPVFLILNVIAVVLLKLFRQQTNIDSRDFSEEEIMSMLDIGREQGVLKEEGQKMISSIFNFDDELAYEIMTPRTDVFAIDINADAASYIDHLMELKYSRIPVFDDDTDNIIGILYIKDYLIKARENGFDNVDIKDILRKPYFVPDTKNIDSLFFELQKEKQHIAILIDEYGGFTGIVTMEDIIEEIVGDIDDEYDDAHMDINNVAPNIYIVDGRVDLDDLEDETGILLHSENSETLGGYIIDMLGEIPSKKEKKKRIEDEKYIFEILSIADKRINKVKIIVKDEVNEDK